MINKYVELLYERHESPAKEHREISPFKGNNVYSPMSSEDNFSIMRIIYENQDKQLKQKEVCIIDDTEMDYEIEETCNSEISKVPERLSHSVIIPETKTERFFIDEKIETGKRVRKGRHKRMESRSFDKFSLNKIRAIDLESPIL